MLHVGALGTDFRSASMGMRDALYLQHDRLQGFLDAVPKDTPLHEIVALCTCNRIEVYYVCKDHAAASEWLRGFLADFHHVPLAHLERVFREYRGEEAVRHLFRVASGTESMVFGEHEILAQIRDAYFCCFNQKTTDSYLNRLFQQAIATGKKVRSETRIGKGSLSIISVALERMTEIVGDLPEKSVLVIGAGAMGVRALLRLKDLGVRRLALANRNNERALGFCTHFGACHVPFDQLLIRLCDYDISLFATSAQEPLIFAGDLLRVRQDTRPLLILDVGAPRNVDPAVADLHNVTLVSIDGLRETADRRLGERRQELDEITAIIEKQVTEFFRWYTYKNGHSPCSA
jgi:glutamyl-tRNA reductase